jgi:hypothetical protein
MSYAGFKTAAYDLQVVCAAFDVPIEFFTIDVDPLDEDMPGATG